MLLDAAKRVEAQTLRLFKVALARGIQLLTFVNKYDRPGMEPLAMLDHIERTHDLQPSAMTWSVGESGRRRRPFRHAAVHTQAAARLIRLANRPARPSAGGRPPSTP